jgi:hypothetical protein
MLSQIQWLDFASLSKPQVKLPKAEYENKLLFGILAHIREREWSPLG